MKRKIIIVTATILPVIACAIALEILTRTPVKTKTAGGGIWHENTQKFISPNELEKRKLNSVEKSEKFWRKVDEQFE
jgi:hypothetical protein